ncbi:hypothetical protein EDD11_002134 [Mortierella claussenii]|nr:hypothetical protein EDD11_002134 [Mortierella claussenii]
MAYDLWLADRGQDLTGVTESIRCCYTFNCQPLQPSYPRADISTASSTYNAPPTFSLVLTASSQLAVNTPGQIYLAVITFPTNYVISAIPAGCTAVSINSVQCTSVGSSRLIASFPSIFISSSSSIGSSSTNFVPKLESVIVNGEQCSIQSACPVLTPSISAPSVPSTTTTSMTRSPTQSIATSSCPPCSTTPSRNPNNNDGNGAVGMQPGTSNNNIGLITGLTLGVIALILLACICLLLRRFDQHSSSRHAGAGPGPKSMLGPGAGDEAGTGAGTEAKAETRAGAPSKMRSLSSILWSIRQKGPRLSLGRSAAVGADIPVSGTAAMARVGNSDPSSLECGRGYGVYSGTGSDSRVPAAVSEGHEKHCSISTQESEAAAVTKSLINRPPALQTTLIDIPEIPEPYPCNNRNTNVEFRSRHEEMNERRLQQDSSDVSAVAADKQPLQRPGPVDFASSSSKLDKKRSWVASVAVGGPTRESGSKSTGRNSKLHRAVTAASSRLGFHSTSPSISSSDHSRQQQQAHTTSSESSTSRFLNSGIGLPSFIRPVKSVHRVPSNVQRNRSVMTSLEGGSGSASDNPRGSASKSTINKGSVITTIRPQHHQEQIRQLQLERDPESGDEGESISYPEYGLVRVPGGPIGNKNPFIIPAPPPFPPPPIPTGSLSTADTIRSKSRNNNEYTQLTPDPPATAMTLSTTNPARKGYAHPIRIRALSPQNSQRQSLEYYGYL